MFIIGMTEGTFPDYRAKGAALDEESRSAFVAVTRSKRLLYLTYPKLVSCRGAMPGSRRHLNISKEIFG